MKREFLEELKIDKEVIDKIMAENGKDIEAEKAKVTTKQTELDGVKTQLTEANKQIEAFKGMDIEKIKQAADDWKVKAETAQTEAQKQIAQLQFDYALETELSKAGARNPKTIKALLNVEGLKNVDGNIIGLKEQLDKLKTDEAYLFVEEAGGGDGGASTVKVKSGGEHKPGGNPDYEKMSDDEYYASVFKKDTK